MSELIFYCQKGHEPVAAVGNDLCASCGGEMKEIGWFETDVGTDNPGPA